MKKIFKGVMISILIYILFTGAYGFTSYAEENDQIQKVIKVGWFDSDEGSQAHGYDYEYLQAISQYTGWKYEYVSGSWDECLQRLESGEIDILGFIHKTPERELIYGYPNLPMAVTSGLLVTNIDKELQIGDVANLSNVNIGIVKNNGYNDDFEEYRLKKGLNVTYKEYASLSDISPALERGEIDAAVVAEEDKSDTERVIVKFTSQNQYFATDIDNQELLSELDAAMIQVNTYCPYLNNDLYQKYFSVNYDGKPMFTTTELEFIKNNQYILVMYDSGWPPIEYFDEDAGEYKGISPSLFKLLSEKCGINFVYEGSTSGEILSHLKNEESKNILTTISYDYKWAEQHDVYITQPFITSNIVKIGKNLNDKNPKVAINEKAYFTYALANELEGLNTINYNKQIERLEAVRTKKADYTFVTEDQANYYRSIPKYSDLDIEQMVGYEQKICISIEKSSDIELMSIISKSLASITHDEMTAIVIKNTVNSYEWTVRDFFYVYKTQAIIILILTITVIATLVAMAIYRRKVSNKIKLAYEQKKEALTIAEKASKAKGSFMSRMSHEIRTPLNAIIGYNTIAQNEISKTKNVEEQKKAQMKTMDCLMKSDMASKHLLTIINDVLDVSAIESGKIKVAHEHFDFKGLINSLTTIFYSQAKTRNIEFEVIIDKLTQEWFIGDQLRVNQILTNLLSNAIKFTPEGGDVKLIINQSETETNLCNVSFMVIDSGIGMSDEFIENIWEPFEQADATISRRFGGTGLGMTITKNLVDLMEGSIRVESVLGKGTTFYVDLTFEKTERPLNLEHYDFNGINALIVDDDRSTCDYIKLLFERCGARCTAVTSGEEAVDTFAYVENTEDKFTICLVDWRMPKMDGIETIRRIRKIAQNEVPIIVISAYDITELMDKAAEVGVKRYISKPLFQSTLFDLLTNINGDETPKKIEKSKDTDFKGAKLILAEDNKMNMEIACRILGSYGLSVDKAWNGREAVELFTNSSEGTYSIILMDIHMPEVNGYQATKKIRTSEHAEAKTIPIIAMTADAFAEDVAESHEAGMNDHISKPIDVRVLLDKLNTYIITNKEEL